MKSVPLNAFVRSVNGRAEVKKLRDAGRVPATIYGRLNKPENLELDKRRLEEMKRFDPRFAKRAEANPEITLGEVIQMESAQSSERPNARPTRKKKQIEERANAGN